MPIKNVDYYYQKFIRFIDNINKFYEDLSKEYDCYKNRILVYDENLIRMQIQKIIDANYNYLLTTSFINYLVDISNEDGADHFDETLNFNLETFGNQYDRLETVIYFIDRSIDTEYYDLTDYESSICNIYRTELKKAATLNKIELAEYYFMKDVFIVIAALAIRDHKTEEELLMNLEYYVNNWKDCLDDISMQIQLNLVNINNQYNRTQLLDLLVGRLDSSHREIR
jgi:hypothetical protein